METSVKNLTETGPDASDEMPVEDANDTLCTDNGKKQQLILSLYAQVS